MPVDAALIDVDEEVDAPSDTVGATTEVVAEMVADAPIMDAEPVIEGEVNGNVAGAGGDRPAPRGSRKRTAAAPRTPKAKAVKTAKPRARKSTRGKSEAADSSS